MNSELRGMPERTRLALLVLIMCAVALCVGGMVGAASYRTALQETKERLTVSAKSQASLIRSVALFNLNEGHDSSAEAMVATLRLITDAHDHYDYGGFGETGEFVLGRLDDGQISFLLRHRHLALDRPRPVPFDSDAAEPMRRALNGRSGTMIGTDYRGVSVLAAHEPVAGVNLGIVAKIDMAEVRAPYIRAAWIAGGGALLLVALGAVLFVRVSNPMIVKIEKQKARLQAILDTAAEAIVSIDAGGVIESFNAAAERMFGYTADEAIGRNVNMLMPSPYREEHGDYISRYLETGEARLIGSGREVPGRRKDGTIVPLELNVSRVDHLRMFTGIMRDISKRKQAEAQLRQEHEFSESIISTANAVILVLDSQGRIVRINPFLERLTGHVQNEVVGKDWFETFLPERDRSRVRQIFQDALKGRSVEGNVNPIVSKQGGERDIAWWATDLRDADGALKGVLSVGLDVTDLNRAQERLVQAERLSAIGEAMTGLAHESRNALARTQANLRRLARRVKDEPELLQLIDGALVAQEDVQRLFEEVRQYAAPLRLKRELTDVRELVRAAWEETYPERDGRNARICESEDDLKCDCEVDRLLMRNAVRNILENALSACDDPVVVDVTYAEADLNGQSALQVSIRDNGPGMPSHVSERVFDAFFTTRTQGTGLGLAIVKRAVEEHGGRISVKCREGSGAEFILILPMSSP